MAYVTARELRAVVPDEYRDAALSDQGAQPEPGLLAAVIETACQEVDALIEGRVRLPLSTPYPQKIRTAALYFALEILFTRRGVEMPEATAKKISWIRTDLGKVGAGDLRLEAPADQTAESQASSGSIVVRPSITGSGGMIGSILLLLSCLAHSAQAVVDSRTFDFIAPTNPLIESADYMEWSRAESVGLRYRLSSADATREARWEISDPTNLWLNLAPSRSGAVWSWNPAPTQTCMPAGRYVGRVAVYDRSGTNLTFHRILAFQDVRVHEARDPASLIMASPLATIFTGTPIYVESDAAGLAAASGVQSNLTLHAGSTNNPHHVTAGQIGALTAEADAAGLAAASGVQSNLTLHAGSTNNPHHVTADQIGAVATQNGNILLPQERVFATITSITNSLGEAGQAEYIDAFNYGERYGTNYVRYSGQDNGYCLAVSGSTFRLSSDFEVDLAYQKIGSGSWLDATNGEWFVTMTFNPDYAEGLFIGDGSSLEGVAKPADLISYVPYANQSADLVMDLRSAYFSKVGIGTNAALANIPSTYRPQCGFHLRNKGILLESPLKGGQYVGVTNLPAYSAIAYDLRVWGRMGLFLNSAEYISNGTNYDTSSDIYFGTGTNLTSAGVRWSLCSRPRLINDPDIGRHDGFGQFAIFEGEAHGNGFGAMKRFAIMPGTNFVGGPVYVGANPTYPTPLPDYAATLIVDDWTKSPMVQITGHTNVTTAARPRIEMKAAGNIFAVTMVATNNEVAFSVNGTNYMKMTQTGGVWVSSMKAGTNSAPVTTANTNLDFWLGTAAEYAALPATNALTVYFIKP